MNKLQEETNVGNYVWRGRKKIDLVKEEDRFTVISPDPHMIEKLSVLNGVHELSQLTPNIYKIKTSSTEREQLMSIMRSQDTNLVVHHAYRPKGSDGTIYYLTNQINLSFKAGTPETKIEQLLEKYKLILIQAYDQPSLTYLVGVTSDSKENPIKVSNRLMEEPEIEYAEPNMINRFQPMYIPSDNLFPKQWHLNPTAGLFVDRNASVFAPDAWDLTKGNRSIVVAVIDDGFDLSHPDFQGEGKIVFPKDYSDNDSWPFPEGEDYHGTPCAGVAVAEENGQGVVGVAPGCSLMPIRINFNLIMDDRKFKEIFEETAIHADVISCSWGPAPANAPLPAIVEDTFTRISVSGGPRGKGCVICFAAANFNAPINNPDPNQIFRWRDYEGRARETRGAILNGNAVHPNVVAVAASTSMNRHSEYSNWGKEISVCAPSNNFDPRLSRYAPGLGIWTTDNENGGFDSGIFTGRFGGTSSATPLVAGISALMLSANPNLTAKEVKEILQRTADKIADDQPDLEGNKRGRYDQNGHSEWFGYGKVNAFKAVQEAKRLAQPAMEPQTI